MRTDIHAAKSEDFDPEMYSYRFGVDFHSEEGNNKDRMRFIKVLASEGVFPAKHTKHGNCGHCGSALRYAGILVRDNEWIYVGETCMDNRFELSKADFQELRRNAQLNRDRMRKTEKLNAFVDTYPELAWFTYPDVMDEYSTFVYDVAMKFRRDGELSEKQIDSVLKAMAREDKWRWEKESEVKVDAPSGLTQVIGTIKSFKIVDNPYAYNRSTIKMIVKDDRGFTVYCTLPTSLTECNEGDKVSFMVDLTVSDRDSTFAFGKRPSKAKKL